MKQTVRIIGGKYRGKKINFPTIEGLRPTPDRVKETLFNWLMNDIRGARCLDAFAGSGSLGFEAFSREAQQVVFIEASKEAYEQLKLTARSFESASLTVIHENTLSYLEKTPLSFDIIFLDPPFNSSYLANCLELLARDNLLAKNGLLYIEAPEKITLNTQFWQEKKSKKAGQVTYSLYEKK